MGICFSKGEKLRPWQKEAVRLVKSSEESRIHVIIDKPGSSGKSTLVHYLESRLLAQEIPVLGETRRESSSSEETYVVELPNSQANFEALLSYLERIKSNGSKPQILILAPHEKGYLFLDSYRWKVWLLNRRKGNLLQEEDLARR